VGFEVGPYDKRLPLVIDPVLKYSTYLGGSDEDYGMKIAVDSSGNAYVAGYTGSPEFPIQSAYQSANAGSYDAFVTKLNTTGSALVYSTYLGGSGWDDAYGIAVDASGSAYVTGYTDSTDFPFTSGAFQTSLLGLAAAYVTKLDPSGSALVYSTYLGGTYVDWGTAIAVDSSGQAYVMGSAFSDDFPVQNAYDETCGSDGLCDSGNYFDGFLAKLDAAGATLMYSTYLGGSEDDFPSDLALDSSGNAYVTGQTYSPDFPTTPNAYDTVCGTDGDCNVDYTDVFVTKVNPFQSGAASLVYSTYLGGSVDDGGSGIAVDSSGKAYVAGYTQSYNFPTTAGAYDLTCGTDGACDLTWDAFVIKINPSGSGPASLAYSTYLGGSGGDEATVISVDSSGNAYVVGDTDSTDFPMRNPIQATYAGGTCVYDSTSYPCYDLFVSKLAAAGSSLLYSTYLGGSGDDIPWGIALDSGGSVYVAGYTYSTDFPTTAGVFDTTCGTDEPPTCNGGLSDAFVAKIALQPVASVAPASLAFGSQLVGVASASQPVTLRNPGDGVLTISSITFSGTNPSDFAQSGCGTSVAAGASCTINVTFTPAAVGPRAATLTVTHNAPSGSDSVTLSGTGTDFSIAPASGSPSEATVNAGQTGTYNLTVRPNGFSGNASLSCAWVGTQPRGTTCAVSPTSVALDGSTPQNATVAVTTTARSLVAPLMRLPVSGLGGRLLVPWLLWLMAFASLAMLAAARQEGWAWLRKVSPLGVLLFVVLLWSACGGGGGGAPPPEQKGTPAGTYSLTISATSGSASRSTTLTLHVN